MPSADEPDLRGRKLSGAHLLSSSGLAIGTEAGTGNLHALFHMDGSTYRTQIPKKVSTVQAVPYRKSINNLKSVFVAHSRTRMCWRRAISLNGVCLYPHSSPPRDGNLPLLMVDLDTPHATPTDHIDTPPTAGGFRRITFAES
jgi:hypothetical protein